MRAAGVRGGWGERDWKIVHIYFGIDRKSILIFHRQSEYLLLMRNHFYVEIARRRGGARHPETQEYRAGEGRRAFFHIRTRNPITTHRRTLSKRD